MRNLKRALSLALSSVMLLGMMVVGTSAASYPDVDAQDNLEAIEVLEMLGVMSGDEKGNFNPDAKITRNEMAVVMTHLLNLNAGGTSPFTDVPTWAQPYVAACYANGVTAGTSATTYGGSANVTATEAALMVMKALGYFGYQGEFGDNWSLAVVKQAQKVGLFDGVSAAVTSQITRSEAAQICLNALESTVTVVTQSGGGNINMGDGSVVLNPSYSYEDVKNTKFDYASNDKDEVQQLCEKLYGDKLTKDTTGGVTDKFGRNAAKWSYSTKSVTAPEKADLTYTAEVSAKTLYNDLGLNKAVTATTNTDGKGTSATGSFEITKTGNAADKTIGGNGATVEVYKTEAGQTVTVKIVVVNNYGGVIKSVNDKNDDRTVTVEGEKAYKTDAFAEDDVVVYTKADGEIQTMALAKKAASGEVTRKVTTAGKESLTIGGTEYKVAETFDIKDIAVKSGEYDLYVDANGYAIYAAETKAGEAQYAVVLDVKSNGWTSGNGTAKIVLADGTQAEVEFKSNEKVTAEIVKKNNVLVAYTVKDGVYTFTQAVNDTPASYKIEKGNATLDTNLYADSKTVFIVRSGDKDSYTYTSYTGIKNVPTIKDAKATVISDSTIAKLVYVTSGSESISDGNFIYVAGASETKGNDGEVFYTYNAVVDGKITTVDSSKALNGLYDSVTYDKNGKITSSSAAKPGDKSGTASKVGDVSNGLVTLDTKKYSYADNVVVYEIDKDGKITQSSMKSVENTASASVYFTLKDNVITALYVAEK